MMKKKMKLDSFLKAFDYQRNYNHIRINKTLFY